MVGKIRRMSLLTIFESRRFDKHCSRRCSYILNTVVENKKYAREMPQNVHAKVLLKLLVLKKLSFNML